MKIALAQYAAIPGDISANLKKHLVQAEAAADAGADLIIFPELSITGYEPELIESRGLATTADDPVFQSFQSLADRKEITVIVGCPTRHESGTRISLLAYMPGRFPQTYSKYFLHEDEDRYFVPGDDPSGILENNPKIALSICWENAVPEHQVVASSGGAEVYLCSVASSVPGITAAHERLSKISQTYGMTSLISNYVGKCVYYTCGGRSAIWDKNGALSGTLNSKEESILFVEVRV